MWRRDRRMSEWNTHPKNARSWLKHMVGLLVTVLCIAIIARKVDGGAVLDALGHFHWPWLIGGIGCLAAGYSLRIVRWSILLGATGAPVTFRTCAAPFLGSIALNNVLPLRLGDVVRALVFPAAMNVSRTTATSSLVIERLIDLMTLLCCLSIGLFAVRTAVIPPLLAKSAVSLAIAGGVMLGLGFLFSASIARLLAHQAARRGGRVATLWTAAASLAGGLAAMTRPRILAPVLLVSLLVWAGESGLFYCVLRGCGLCATPAMALLVMAVATLSTLAPSSPGYVGPFHLAAFAAIALVGGTPAQAGSFAVLCHLALWAPTTLAGGLAIATGPELFRHARRPSGAAFTIGETDKA